MICSCPRIVIAGVQSGVGKTSITLSLVAALRRRGLKVQTFKVGPDFLDPTYLAAVSDRPSYNLDSWMGGSDYVRTLFARATRDADIAVIEGVMGLFDGAEPGSLRGSTAEIARLLEAPVLLIVDSHGIAGSIAAVVEGFRRFASDVRVSGVIANRAGSPSHLTTIRRALAAADSLALVGCVPRGALPSLPSRHLGLETADPHVIRTQLADRLADAADTHISCQDAMDLARTAPRVEAADPAPPPPPPERGARVRIAVAWDEAFHFYYSDFLELLAQRGADLVRFSPIHDEELPPACGGLYLGGGYPEEFAESLAANSSMHHAIREHASSGKPVYAECGGLMYLSSRIAHTDGNDHPMVGLLPCGSRMLQRRKALGYEAVTLTADTFLGNSGTTFRGHEFHYSELTDNPTTHGDWSTAYRCKAKRSNAIRFEGYRQDNVLASYVHLYLGPHTDSIDTFINSCRN